MFLSYLTQAHIMDRVAEETFIALGAAMGYWQGRTKTLLDDVGALRPTIFVAVPHTLDSIILVSPKTKAISSVFMTRFDGFM